uniref:Uncharacterized protein n=1 Tax=Rhizophora mucronata TaxID=61149 RepID=A0A2P2J2U3_RHIMU
MEGAWTNTHFVMLYTLRVALSGVHPSICNLLYCFLARATIRS